MSSGTLAKPKPLYVGLCLTALFPPLLLPGSGALITLALVLVILWRVPSSRRPTLDWKFKSTLSSVLAGMLAAGCITLFLHLLGPMLEQLFGKADLNDFSNVRGNLVNYLLLLAVGVGFGGILEELMFRGYVIGWGTQLLGERAAYPLALLSGSIFGFTHLYQGWGGVVETGLVGLSLGLLYIICRRRLLPSIIAHSVLDIWGITQIYLGT